MDQARELARGLRIALAGRRPFDLHGRAARRPDRLGERRQADVHDLELLLEQGIHRPGSEVWRAAICAASRTAWALLSANSTPASRSDASWRGRSCGSPAVPHTEPTRARSRPRLCPELASSRVASSLAGSGCAVAQHDVEQDHGHLRICGLLQDPLPAQRLVDHGVDGRE